MISWFGPQNQAGFFLSVAPQNRWEGDGVRHISRCSGLLRMEAIRARISQSGLKNSGGEVAGGTCGTIVEVALESS
jgi:hypothetical protein